MNRNGPDTVEEVVQRFLRKRQAGQRVSIDDVIDDHIKGPDRARTRVSALEVITQLGRIGNDSVRLSHAGLDADYINDSTQPLPEIEGYDIIDIVGRGGMGIVYEAYQRSTGRRVALKLMLDSAASAESARRRFEREVELVVRLRHPSIVWVIDSGMQSAKLYYVMEFVHGDPLDVFITPGVANIKTTLALIKKICEAVDFAHQRGVLHRDLKPANILIDDTGEPRLLDFGLAKAIGADKAAARNATISRPGQLLGTLAYMPPEQARGQLEQISVRSDVYALGAILYELLTGKIPIKVDDALDLTLLRITNTDPPAPSSIRPEIPRDLDAVVLKALEKQPNRRYPTAGELADDLGRILKRKPVTARRAGPVERARRWVTRNRRVSAVASASLILILAVSAFAAVRITSSARSERRVEAVATEARDWIHRVAPLGPHLTVLQVVNKHSDAAWDQPPEDPEVAAAVHISIGENFVEFQMFRDAEAHFRAARTLNEQELTPPHERLATNYHLLGRCAYWMNNYALAEELYRKALDMRRELFGTAHESVAETLNHLALTLMRRRDLDIAEEYSRDVIELRRNIFGPSSTEVAAALNNLALCLQAQEKWSEAETIFRDSLDLARTTPDDKRDRNIAVALHNLGSCLIGMDRHREAEAPLLESLTLKQLLYKDNPNNRSTAVTLHKLSRANLALGYPDAALERCEQALTMQRAVYSSADPERNETPHYETADSLMLLGDIRFSQGDATGALVVFQEALDMRSRLWPEGRIDIDHARVRVGACLEDLGRDKEARTQLEKALLNLPSDSERAHEAERILAQIRSKVG